MGAKEIGEKVISMIIEPVIGDINDEIEKSEELMKNGEFTEGYIAGLKQALEYARKVKRL